MRSKVPSSITTAVFAALLAVSAPMAAHAMCEQSATFTGSSGQLLADVGKQRSPNFGLAVMPLVVCPAFDGWVAAFDVWNRFDKSGLHLNETDLELALSKQWGMFSTELYVGYYDLPPQPLRQGVVQLYADFGYRILDLDWLKVKVAARPIQMFGTGGIGDLTLLRARARAEMPLDFVHSGVSLSLEPSVVYNLTQQPGQPKVSIRPEVSLDWDANKRLRFSLAGKAANGHAIGELAMRIKF